MLNKRELEKEPVKTSSAYSEKLVSDQLAASHLFSNGLQISVTHEVFSQLYSGESGASRVWE